MRRHPPYHIRPNKTVDRVIFIETIRRSERLYPPKQYTYHGFGGPMLEEFRILYELCPELRMVSIEEDGPTVLRQRFHLPSKNVELVHNSLGRFLSEFEPATPRSIFWLDFTDLSNVRFAEFIDLLPKLGEGSLIKLSLKCEPANYQRNETRSLDQFNSDFDRYLPAQLNSIPNTMANFAFLIQRMVRVAAEIALQGTSLIFQPVSSFYYSDGVGMFSIAGFLCADRGVAVKREFRSWQFANLNWEEPRLISVPQLSTKERLHLQKYLPSRSKRYYSALGYRLDRSAEGHYAMMDMYRLFHRYFPFFVKSNL